VSLPYFRLYPTDYEADTAHLTLIEDGAYNRLLRLCWTTPGCSLPDDEAWIMRRVRAYSDAEKDAVRTVLSEYFKRENQRVFNARLSREFEHADARHKSAHENGKKGGRPRGPLKTNEKTESNGLANANQTGKLKKANQNQNQNHNTPLPPKGFDEFWQAVPRKVAKPAAMKAYRAALGKAAPDVILAGIVAYAAASKGKDPQFVAHPASWLNSERWADDLSPPDGRTWRDKPESEWTNKDRTEWAKAML
jgi:uncharacterized protein YdaU (DUF1376 family)